MLGGLQLLVQGLLLLLPYCPHHGCCRPHPPPPLRMVQLLLMKLPLREC